MRVVSQKRLYFQTQYFYFENDPFFARAAKDFLFSLIFSKTVISVLYPFLLGNEEVQFSSKTRKRIK